MFHFCSTGTWGRNKPEPYTLSSIRPSLPITILFRDTSELSTRISKGLVNTETSKITSSNSLSLMALKRGSLVAALIAAAIIES